MDILSITYSLRLVMVRGPLYYLAVNNYKATLSHILVSGHPSECKICFQIYEDYYYYHI